MNKRKSLLLFSHPASSNAPTIMDHVKSFGEYSINSFTTINTLYGFPDLLNNYRFDIIVLHYSLFGSFPFALKSPFFEYVQKQSNCIKIAFFQDEYQYCSQRFSLINELKISVIFTLLEESNFNKVYGRCKSVKHIYKTLTGYVSDDLKNKSKLFTKPLSERHIDFGYRARELSFVMGKGAQEKNNIHIRFAKFCEGKNYNLDLSASNKTRIYGDDWYRFVANCKAMLGVEAGVSIFDINGEAVDECTKYLHSNPHCSFDEIYNDVLIKYETSEDNVYYRTISPRIFEAAAFKVCMILFEGSYSGLLQPHIHYIPLKKDFSNISDVFKTFNNSEMCNMLTGNAFNHLIKNNTFTFNLFIQDFDQKINNIISEKNISKQDFHLLDKQISNMQKHYIFKFHLKQKLKKILK